MERPVKEQQAGDEYEIHQRQEHPPRVAADQRAIERLQQQHRDEGAGEQQLQVLGGTERVADRPQHVIAGQQEEEVRKRPAQRPGFPPGGIQASCPA